MKIDVFCHIQPVKYMEALQKETGSSVNFGYLPTMYDLDQRFRVMDKFDGLMQVLTISMPAIENIGKPKKAVDLAKLANDEMAELVLKYPDRFAAAVLYLFHINPSNRYLVANINH